MKKILLLALLLFTLATPCHAVQNSSTKQTKIYDKNGSLQGYIKPESNGRVKTYNKYHQSTGYYKKSGSKVKYYSKK